MVLAYIETKNGNLKKPAFEVASFAARTAKSLGMDCAAILFNEVENPEQLGQYGITKVFRFSSEQLNGFDSQVYAAAISETAKNLNASLVIIGNSANGKSLLGRLSVRLNAGSVSGVNQIPEGVGTGLKVRKSVFSGKAIAEYLISSPVKVISLMGNSIPPVKSEGTATVENIELPLPQRGVTVKEIKLQEGSKAPLPEAELVVSAGRGLKGPENWGIIEELADELGATTACSRPVADAHWRPHHEHVGQTGVAIRPNLYIAIGISGAIQHLAGVNNSKTIVVINKDPEAPFFKAADYGVCGDLFEVIPKLTAAVKEFKTNNH